MTAGELAAVVRIRLMCRSGEAARIRHRAMVSQSELADAADLRSSSLGMWERGECMPPAEAALRYGAVLDMLAATVDGHEGERTPPLFDLAGRTS